jgi:hypothetical protein
MMIMTIGHECKWGTVMGDQQVEGGEKERILRGEENQSTVHICI